MNGKMAEIRTRLMAGSIASELIGEGYAPSSVYAVRKTLKGRKSTTPKSSHLATVPSVSHSVSNDPDIVRAQKKLAMAELANKIEAAEGNALSPTVKAIHAAGRRKGYRASLREFVDITFARLIIDYPDSWLDDHFTKWAYSVLDGRVNVDEQLIPEGQFISGFSPEIQSAFFEWLSQQLPSDDDN